MISSTLPAIVVAAYNRPDSLRQILKSIEVADYKSYISEQIPLIISIDPSEVKEVKQVADEFLWSHGEKKVILHNSHLGLRKHILTCGGLSQSYGAVVVLEDDLRVSPAFYDYACQAYQFYNTDTRIAGISLYGYDFSEHAQLKFQPLDDNHDNYFMQSPSSWGQLWTKNQWAEFIGWYEKNKDNPIAVSDGLPDNVVSWSDRSWKKYFIKFMVQQDKFFVFPRYSFTTNLAVKGSHHLGISSNYQVPLKMTSKRYQFSRLDHSYCKYDCFFEILPESIKKFTDKLESYKFDVDLYGMKNLQYMDQPYLLSTKTCVNPLFTFGLNLLPQELNIFFEEAGQEISFGLKKDFSNKPSVEQYVKILKMHKNFGWKNFSKLASTIFLGKLKSKAFKK